jgi:inorganic pyrophosphatase
LITRWNTRAIVKSNWNIHSTINNIKKAKELGSVYILNYKKLEKGKWVRIVGWENSKKALDLIEEAITRAK